jgi:hypothetical protein
LSVLFSSAYIFIVRHEEEVSLARLSEYPQPAMRDELFLAIGEIHHPRRPEPSPNPQWLIVPERGLFTGIAIFGAIYPTEQFAVISAMPSNYCCTLNDVADAVMSPNCGQIALFWARCGAAQSRIGQGDRHHFGVRSRKDPNPT